MSINYLTIEQICKKLHIAPGTGRNRLSKSLNLMPPSIRAGRRRLFPENEFEKWMASYLERGDQKASDSMESEK